MNTTTANGSDFGDWIADYDVSSVDANKVEQLDSFDSVRFHEETNETDHYLDH